MACSVRHSTVSEGLRLESGKRRMVDKENIVLRNYHSPPNSQRYSLVNSPHYMSDHFPTMCGSSVSLSVNSEDTQSLDSLLIPRCSSECNFTRKPSSSDPDCKRSSNQSLKTFLQKKFPPAMRRKQGKFSSKEDSASLHSCSSNARIGHSDFPFYMPAIESPDQIDLSNCGDTLAGAVVRPLHYSILGRDHCFEVVTSSGARCFACESSGERQAWIEKIKRAVKPNLDNSRRLEHQLILFVQEAKGLPSKKKYFCEICLDRKLCARTTSKWKNESGLFWAEHFEFTPPPGVTDVTVHLYKDSDKKRKKDKDYIGLVNLPVKTLLNQQSVEKWYTLSTPSGNNKNKAGEVMALRVKARFISTRVLPTEMYKRFAEYVSNNYLHISHALSNIISVTRKDEIARILVNIMFGTGCLTKYMTDIVMNEVEKVEEESLIFRENTIGTKSVEAMLRLVGMQYLNSTLGDFIQALFNMEEECEVDGSRLPPQASLETNQKNLMMSCEIALCKIVSSTNQFPGELREVMSSWRVHCEAANRPRIANRLVTASLFLRLLCPAIFNPSLFGLAKEIPDARVSRTLTLIAKVIQNLANRTRFGVKEEYMSFMDVFVREKWDEMGTFIGNVSDPSIPPLPKGFQGYIDLGKEFAKLHAFFVEIRPTLDKKTIENLGELPSMLDEITTLLDKPLEHGFVSSSGLHLKEPSVSSEILHPVASSSAFNTASSMMDLRQLVDGSSDLPPHTADDFPLYSKNSQSSLAIACSHNNSNNNPGLQARNVLSPINSTPSELSFPSTPIDEPEQTPLMFKNPAYKIPSRHDHRASRTSLSQLHDSLNLQHKSMIRTLGQDKQQNKTAQKENQNPHHQAIPLSFSNPLQLFHNQHLETTFGAETVTYTSGSNDFQKPSHNANSNNSSLSTRQSSTTTDSQRSSSPDETSDSLPVHSPRLSKHQVSNYGAESHDTDRFLLPPESISQPVSSAHLKTGLQSSSQRQRHGEAPQPKPRKSCRQDQKVPHRKFSVPSVATSASPRSSVRRGSMGNPQPSFSAESTAKYPKFELLRGGDHDAVLKLNEPESRPSTSHKHNSKVDGSGDGFVAQPVAAVKSRVVVTTANANRVKTSTSKQKSQHSSQGVRRDKQRRDGSGKALASLAENPLQLFPKTPEVMSPEARTAQWVLNSDPPNSSEGGKEEAIMSSKDYENRILRLESEILNLRTTLKHESDARATAEQNEAASCDKLRAAEKRESRLRKQLKEKDDYTATLSRRVFDLEVEIKRERDSSTQERNRLVVQLQSKEKELLEQKKVIESLRKEILGSTQADVCPAELDHFSDFETNFIPFDFSLSKDGSLLPHSG